MKRSVLAVFLLVLCACPATKLDVGPATGAPPATCNSGCTAEWERAQLWIVNHSRLKIQLATDVTIQTYNPPDNSTDFAFSATKEPIGGDSYRITLGMGCVNLISCGSRPEDIKAAFNYYVSTGTDILAGRSPRGLR
ncbi:MAG: hypothetical protein ACJ79K_04610 [Gemmatimonadaceae bacterium]